MKTFNSKMIVPVVITAFVVLYYVLYFALLVTLLEGILRWILGVIPLLLSIVMIKVCLERINEIQKGEEDDLSQY